MSETITLTKKEMADAIADGIKTAERENAKGHLKGLLLAIPITVALFGGMWMAISKKGDELLAHLDSKEPAFNQWADDAHFDNEEFGESMGFRKRNHIDCSPELRRRLSNAGMGDSCIEAPRPNASPKAKPVEVSPAPQQQEPIAGLPSWAWEK